LINSVGYSQHWAKNFEEAKTQAILENKNILLVFSGSDWCAPCVKLDKELWKSKEFQAESNKNWVLYKADFPKKKEHQLSKELVESNKKLAAKYNKEGSFPFIVLIDKAGKIIGTTGFKNVTAKEYIQLIHSFKENVK
jgi:thioredoxin-related protein